MLCTSGFFLPVCYFEFVLNPGSFYSYRYYFEVVANLALYSLLIQLVLMRNNEFSNFGNRTRRGSGMLFWALYIQSVVIIKFGSSVSLRTTQSRVFLTELRTDPVYYFKITVNPDSGELKTGLECHFDFPVRKAGFWSWLWRDPECTGAYLSRLTHKVLSRGPVSRR